MNLYLAVWFRQREFAMTYTTQKDQMDFPILGICSTNLKTGSRGMEIVIFETEHFETGYALVKLFDLPGYTITVFTNRYCFSMMSDMLKETADRIHWCIQENNEKQVWLIYRLHQFLRRHPGGILFYSTIASNHFLHGLVIRLHPNHRSILTLHDINNMFQMPFRLNFRHLARKLGKRFLLQQAGEFNVLSTSITASLRKHLGPEAVIHEIPGAIYEPAPVYQRSGNTLRLVVAGTVDRERRDYNKIFELLDLAERSKIPIELNLLGAATGPYGKAIIRRAADWKGQYTRILFSETGLVPAITFEKEIRNADFIFIPIVEESYANDQTREVYGATKTTGNLFDAIRYAKPILYPVHLHVPERQQPGGYCYRTMEDLAAFLAGIFQQPGQYENWKNRAITVSSYFTVDSIRKENPSIFSVNPAANANDSI